MAGAVLAGQKPPRQRIYERAGVQAVLHWGLEEEEKRIDKGQPLEARTLNHLAAEYAELGDKERAIALLERAY